MPLGREFETGHVFDFAVLGELRPEAQLPAALLRLGGVLVEWHFGTSSSSEPYGAGSSSFRICKVATS